MVPVYHAGRSSPTAVRYGPHAMRRSRQPGALLAAAIAVLLALGACDRNVEPFQDEAVREPDLSKIFPKGADRAAEQEGGGPGAMGSGPAGGGSGGPPGAPPGGAPGAPAAQRGGGSSSAGSSDGRPVRGTIRLAPELERSVPEGAVLFLVARGEGGGPPVAVRRVTQPSFPLDFEIGPEDRMMENVPFAGPFRLTVRVDADGNASTQTPGDLRGAAEGVHRPGATGVSIRIDEVL